MYYSYIVKDIHVKDIYVKDIYVKDIDVTIFLGTLLETRTEKWCMDFSVTFWQLNVQNKWKQHFWQGDS